MTNSQLRHIVKRIDDLERRIRALEGDDLNTKANKRGTSRQKQDFSGATGGIRFLIKNGFFRTKRNQVSIRKELASKNYHYSSQAVYGALKALSKHGGPLVVLKDKRLKVYVERK